MEDPGICATGVGAQQFVLSVCSLFELPEFSESEVTHLFSIWGDPRSRPNTPYWIEPANHFHFNFNDVEHDTEDCVAPTREDVINAIEIGQLLIDHASVAPVHLLIHCYAGVSRSTAMALAILMMFYGPGGEVQAVGHLLQLRPQAMPNARIVHEVDILFGCNGQLVAAVDESVIRTISG